MNLAFVGVQIENAGDIEGGTPSKLQHSQVPDRSKTKVRVDKISSKAKLIYFEQKSYNIFINGNKKIFGAKYLLT